MEVVFLRLPIGSSIRKPRAAFTTLRRSPGEQRGTPALLGEPPSPTLTPCRGRNICIIKRALLNDRTSGRPQIWEWDMSKPRLLLIHCSNGIRPRAKHRQHGRSFRPFVIHGGARARSVPRESSWEAALKLIDLGFLIFHVNCLAFLQASTTVLEAHNWTDPETTS
jgi:hypothetical protein